MTADLRERGKIRRIVVAIDASKHSLAGLEAAVDLARQLDADLTGLFIEDINLLRLAEIPNSYQVGRLSLARKRLSQEEVRRQLSTQRSWAYEALESLCHGHGLRWSFQVERGSILAELTRATDEADLTILGKSGWSDTRLVGSTAQALLAHSGGLTLILREGVRLGRSVMALLDNSDASWEALEIASALPMAKGRKLVLMLLADSRQSATAMEKEIRSWNQGRGFDLTYLRTQEPHPLIVCSTARTESSGILVIPREIQGFSDDDLAEVLNQITCPVLFVGSPAQAVH